MKIVIYLTKPLKKKSNLIKLDYNQLISIKMKIKKIYKPAD